MKSIFLSLIITLIAIGLGLYAQERETTQTEPKVTLELAWEKECDVPIANYIGDVDEKGNVVLRSVTLLGESTTDVRFLDAKGQSVVTTLKLKSLTAGRLLQSKAGTYIGNYEITKGKPGDVEEVSFSLYGKDGALLWMNPQVKGLPFRILDNGFLL